MSSATTIRVREPFAGEYGLRQIEVVDEENLTARYERLAEDLMRMGEWLAGPRAAMLPPDEWDASFARYQERLRELRELGDRLRPITLRERREPLCGDALVGEVLELFAA